MVRVLLCLRNLLLVIWHDVGFRTMKNEKSGSVSRVLYPKGMAIIYLDRLLPAGSPRREATYPLL
jgi:hypothetical protein